MLERGSQYPEEENASKEEYFKNESKYSNKGCFCGSGPKFKKCCQVGERRRLEEERARRVKGE